MKNEHISSVDTLVWSDPYGGVITNNKTIGIPDREFVIYNSIIVTNGAVLTIPPRSILLFAPLTKIIVENGTLIASGSPLDPIIFTSMNDTIGGAPQPAD